MVVETVRLDPHDTSPEHIFEATLTVRVRYAVTDRQLAGSYYTATDDHTIAGALAVDEREFAKDPAFLLLPALEPEVTVTVKDVTGDV